MRRPRSSLAIGIQLEHGLDLAAHHLAFSLSDNCSPESETVSHKYVASIRIVPRRLLHSDTYAPGYAPYIYIYIYVSWGIISVLCARVCAQATTTQVPFMLLGHA